MDEIVQLYHAFWNQRAAEMKGIIGVFERKHMPLPELSLHKQKTADMLMDGLMTLDKQIRADAQQKEEKQARLERANHELQEMRADVARKTEELRLLHEKARKDICDEREKADSGLKEVLARQKANEDEMQMLQHDMERAQRFLDKKRGEFETTQAFITGKHDGQETTLTADQFFELAAVMSQLEALRKPLDEAEKLFRDTPVYNFGKRNRARAEVELEKKRYSEAAEKLVSTYVSSGKESIERFKQAIEEAERHVTQRKICFIYTSAGGPSGCQRRKSRNK